MSPRIRVRSLSALLVVACFSSAVSARMYFSVKPGFALNSAEIGYTLTDNVHVSGGLEYLLISSYTKDLDGYDTSEYKVAVNYLIPTITGRLVGKNQDLAPYVFGSVLFGLPIVSINSYAESDSLDKENAKNIADRVNFFGTRVGVGTEYFFSRQFSVGGEFGINLIFMGSKDEDDVDIGGMVSEFKGRFGLTRSAVSFNFHF